jgi:hypothetical protein
VDGWTVRRVSLRPVLESIVLLSVAWVLVRLWRLDRLLEWLTPTVASPSRSTEQVREVARYLDAILRRLPVGRGRSCLVRSLALYSRARRSGLPVRFHCGVRRVGSTLDGHAWLTLGGQPFLEPADPAAAYAVTFSFP